MSQLLSPALRTADFSRYAGAGDPQFRQVAYLENTVVSVWPDGHKGSGFCRTDVRGGDRVGNEIETFESLYIEDSAAVSFYIILRTRDFTKAFEDDISNN